MATNTVCPRRGKAASGIGSRLQSDPKDKGNRKLRYEEALDAENRQQDMFYLLAEAMAAMASGKKAEFYRQRLRKGMEWDKQEKQWKWKE